MCIVFQRYGVFCNMYVVKNVLVYFVVFGAKVVYGEVTHTLLVFSFASS